MSSIKVTLYSNEGPVPEITSISSGPKEAAQLEWAVLVGVANHLLRKASDQMSTAQITVLQRVNELASEQGQIAHRATLVNTQAVRKMIDAREWSTKAALALVLEYLRTEDLEDPALDALIVHLASSGRGLRLLTFLQDCAMTGTDKEIK